MLQLSPAPSFRRSELSERGGKTQEKPLPKPGTFSLADERRFPNFAMRTGWRIDGSEISERPSGAKREPLQLFGMAVRGETMALRDFGAGKGREDGPIPSMNRC